MGKALICISFAFFILAYIMFKSDNKPEQREKQKPIKPRPDHPFFSAGQFRNWVKNK